MHSWFKIHVCKSLAIKIQQSVPWLTQVYPFALKVLLPFLSFKKIQVGLPIAGFWTLTTRAVSSCISVSEAGGTE